MRHTRVTFAALAATVALTASAAAGGFARGNADTDIIFEDGNFNMRAGVAVVSPTQRLNTNGFVASSGDILPTYVIPTSALSLNVGMATCAATHTQPFGGSSDYSGTPLGTDTDALRTRSQNFVTNELGLTCGLKYDMGKNRIWILGGGFYQTLDFTQIVTSTAIPLGPANLTLRDAGGGYRIGAAFERPEIALRAQVMYRSAVSVNAKGTFTSLSGPVLNPFATGAATFPQSVEVKLQSGVAPGTLVYGSVKWTDWKKFQVLQYNATGTPASLNFYWRDGWTVNLGVARQFNEKLAGTVSVTWDRGVGTGHDLQGADVWTFAAGASVKPTKGFEIRGGLGLSVFGATAQNFTANPLGGVGAFVSTPGIKKANAGYAIGGSVSGRIQF
jgi:long-chain fatty acid transport protein